ncbi:glycosyltransferase family 2 protein [Variovorax ginsengisoli]|jgi:GT2 family glycosyltransferase|uniref:Glycosyltransferase family 2 protein n=1 Tax=Variovorax ginsengisoli TaxID=363844 RepID=A0ABT8SCU4_9BURK|nr:glycosyltransferase family 2 protein [Variovorax ginsengisoli]MDN8617558.1 glycosyltransferase family 2 protein [Variovorax ginsengisoli]MDO1536728.1 glycosyltransferase family 2 protein [Variovorax ginsengisoli]
MPMPPSSPASITVSIVSHGQLDLVRPLMEELDRFSRGTVAKVVLTINIPETDALAGLHWGFEVERIENPAPMGFGANHNQAFGHCATPWFLVLNPDIRFDRDILAPLVAQARPDSGLLTPRILEPGKDEPEQHRAIITPHEILVRRRPGYQRPAVPHWIPGLFMLFRSDAYREIGGFDERFFMYGEDFDICARTQLAGWKLQVAEDLLARHDAQRASRTSHRHLYWHVTSLLKVWSSAAFWRFRGALRKAQASVR